MHRNMPVRFLEDNPTVKWRGNLYLETITKKGKASSVERREAVRLISAMREKQKSRFRLYARTSKSVPLMYLLS